MQWQQDDDHDGAEDKYSGMYSVKFAMYFEPDDNWPGTKEKAEDKADRASKG